ncbi:MAG: hypothetical protein ACUVQY_05255 [Thermoproteota archaeon]
MIMAALIFLPSSIYLWFAVGSGVSTAATYVTAILFTALTQIYGRRLSKQELFIIYSIVGGIGGAMPMYYWLVYRSYYVTNPLSLEFRLFGIPLREFVPAWMSPPITSPVHQLRTFFHPDWFFALAINIAFSVLGLAAELSIGILFSYLYVVEEPLPFPFAQIDTAMINTLHERKSQDLLYFILSLTMGMIYATILYLTPMLIGPWARLIPYPWIDLTFYTQYFLPGAVIGIATDPLSFLYGMILPPSLTFAMLVGSIITWIFGNTLTLTTFKDFAPQWVEEYSSGMGIYLILQRAGLRLWLSLFMGLSFGLAIFLLASTSKKIVRAFRTLPRISKLKGGPGYPSPRILLIIFFCSTSLSAILYSVLLPEIPFWLPLLVSVGFSFVLASVGARIYGELGLTFSPDFIYNMWKAAIYFSPYNGYAGWIFTPALAGFSTPYFAHSTRVAYSTQTRPMDYFKAVIISSILVTTFGLIFTDFFWRIAPIPSYLFPYVYGIWPNYAISDSLFATRQILIKPDQIVMGIGIAAGVSFLSIPLNKLGIPFNPVGLVGGMYSIPPYTIMVFLMSLVNKYLMMRILGAERWIPMRNVVLAGFAAGVGIIVAMGTTITLVSRASWIWPW